MYGRGSLCTIADPLPLLIALAIVCFAIRASAAEPPRPASPTPSFSLAWETLPELPDPLGVAGPFVGVHRDVLMVAGGANFPEPVWESEKTWHDAVYLLRKTADHPEKYRWEEGGRLPRRIGYGAVVSTPAGVLCMGGNDAESTCADVFLLSLSSDGESLNILEMPPLPTPCAYGQAVLVGGTVYLAGGQSEQSLGTAMPQLWSFDFASWMTGAEVQWRREPDCPGGPWAFNLTTTGHNGFNECIYISSGRREAGGGIEFLTDHWQFDPVKSSWRRCAEVPRCVMAGSSIDVGQSHLLVLGGDDGSLFHEADTLRDRHPGFAGEALLYHSITDSWTSASGLPAARVTTPAVRWNGRIVIASGEVRPRVRSAEVFAVEVRGSSPGFGTVNYIVLFGYLGAMVAIGVYFARRNRNTDDYFRGGKQIPWWAAGCSIFATMLSSLTYTGIPSKAYAQDWVYAIGNLMIPVVAVLAVFVALPFYRRLDVTSAYEYLELRFNRGIRMFGSLSFALFHVFRMGVVMSLTGLALAVATPLTPVQSVLLMGVLSIIYCTLGGIEAVIWTDTIQTVVLLGGAMFALYLLLSRADGGWSEFAVTAAAYDKLQLANRHISPMDLRPALWVVVIGAIGQNVSSYTADQAVVQRYMTTPTRRLAARSIWTNAVLTIPATLLFFGIGTALFLYYRSHPERLDPTIATDQIFPYFIAREAPLGIAGLIVAGIFAAAQSTVSTSMNSTATTVITDFVRPLGHLGERGHLIAARAVTLIAGIFGTWLGLSFVDPEIRSLFDAFIKVIGLFMGVLGGLFVLGVATTRANAFGAAIGAATGTLAMLYLWRFTEVSGFLYTAAGITVCVAAGYTASLATRPPGDLNGLTLHTMTEESGR